MRKNKMAQVLTLSTCGMHYGNWAAYLWAGGQYAGELTWAI